MVRTHHGKQTCTLTSMQPATIDPQLVAHTDHGAGRHVLHGTTKSTILAGPQYRAPSQIEAAATEEEKQLASTRANIIHISATYVMLRTATRKMYITILDNKVTHAHLERQLSHDQPVHTIQPRSSLQFDQVSPSVRQSASTIQSRLK